MNKKTGNFFADPFLFSCFSNILHEDKNADGSYWPDLLKDEPELQSRGICFHIKKVIDCFFRIKQIGLNNVSSIILLER